MAGFKVDGHFIPKSYDTNNDSKLTVAELNIFCRDNDLKYDEKNKKIVSAAGDYSEYDVAEYKLDSQKYSLESLKKRYPESKYRFEYKENEILQSISIRVFDKKTEKLVFSLYKDSSATCIDLCDDNGESAYFRNYDKNGNLLFYDKDNKRHYPIADNIYAAVSAKKGRCLPTTDVNKLVLNVKRITSENIAEITRNYEKTYGESLLDAINNEWGLDKKIKAQLIQHLNKCAAETYSNLSTNGKIDEGFNQGQIGDCWFLASIAAVQRSPKGQEILNNMITDNKDGTYTVKFKGADKEYTVNAIELLSKDNYASGDYDVRILEIAAEKHYNIMGIKNGGDPSSGIELLLGTGDWWKNFARNYSSKPKPEKIKELLQNKNIIMTASIDPLSKLWGLIVKDVPEDAKYKDDIATAHAYAVVDIDDKNIYLKNPWYTEKIISIPLDVFSEYWSCVQYTEIT